MRCSRCGEQSVPIWLIRATFWNGRELSEPVTMHEALCSTCYKAFMDWLKADEGLKVSEP